LRSDHDQSFLAPFVKGFAGIAAIAASDVAFFNRDARKSDPHAVVACEMAPVMALLAAELAILRGNMVRVFAVPLVLLTLLAGAGQVHAEGFNPLDIMGGGPNFFGGGVSPIPRTTVSYSGNYAPGTIIVDTGERRLYLVLEGGQALRYGIGVGRDGYRWSGTHRITAKKEWPSWTPPSQMLARRPDLPRHMAGGIDNPLGARALYLGSTLYRIHGSNEPETIGQAVSSGCFRMTNEDVTDLYGRVSVGTTVVVKN